MATADDVTVVQLPVIAEEGLLLEAEQQSSERLRMTDKSQLVRKRGTTKDWHTRLVTLIAVGWWQKIVYI